MDGIIIQRLLGTFACSDCGEEKEKTGYNEVVGSTMCVDCLTKMRQRAVRNWVAAIHEIYQCMQSKPDGPKPIKEGDIL